MEKIGQGGRGRKACEGKMRHALPLASSSNRGLLLFLSASTIDKDDAVCF